jgi:hypothetical protein
MNVDIPTTGTTGDVIFELDGPDSEKTQATIPIVCLYSFGGLCRSCTETAAVSLMIFA